MRKPITPYADFAQHRGINLLSLGLLKRACVTGKRPYCEFKHLQTERVFCSKGGGNVLQTHCF